MGFLVVKTSERTFGVCREPDPSLLPIPDDGVPDLLVHRLEQIVERRPGLRPDADLSRHARHELQITRNGDVVGAPRPALLDDPPPSHCHGLSKVLALAEVR